MKANARWNEGEDSVVNGWKKQPAMNKRWTSANIVELSLIIPTDLSAEESPLCVHWWQSHRVDIVLFFLIFRNDLGRSLLFGAPENITNKFSLASLHHTHSEYTPEKENNTEKKSFH